MWYQGDNKVLNEPKIYSDGSYKDFGYGFYCTNSEKQAKRWALTKRNRHVVNVYSYTENKNLICLIFKEMSMILLKVQWRMIRYGIMWMTLRVA